MITYSSAWFLAAVMLVLGVSMFVRGLGPRSTGQHRTGRDVTVSFDQLTVVRPGPIIQGFDWCDNCAATTAGVMTRDGFRCDCGTQAGGAR